MDHHQYHWNPPKIQTHKIKLKPKCVLSIMDQRMLNPPIQELVKKETIKWLYMGVFYRISTSTSVSLL